MRNTDTPDPNGSITTIVNQLRRLPEATVDGLANLFVNDDIRPAIDRLAADGRGGSELLAELFEMTADESVRRETAAGREDPGILVVLDGCRPYRVGPTLSALIRGAEKVFEDANGRGAAYVSCSRLECESESRVAV